MAMYMYMYFIRYSFNENARLLFQLHFYIIIGTHNILPPYSQTTMTTCTHTHVQTGFSDQ